MPTGVIQDEHDQLVLAGADGRSKGRQNRAEQHRADTVAQKPDHLAGTRVDETIDIEPLEPVLAKRDRALALGRPSPACDRLEAYPMLIKGPARDRPVRVRGTVFIDPLRQPFLKASGSSARAALACLGRGTCRLCSSVLR